MTERHYLKDGTGATTEITSRIRRTSWEADQKAEEGAYGSWQITIADPAMDFDTKGHRLYWVEEDTSTSGDLVIAAGYTGVQEIGRLAPDTEDTQLLGRAWNVEIVDINTIWDRRIMTGTACNRPAETDVQRMQWLLATTEAALFDDVTTYVSTASGSAMDKNDYRGQSFSQVANDCAQQASKNWFAWFGKTGTVYKVFAWYGQDTLSAYDSSLSLSNDPNDWVDSELQDGTSLIWPISEDTKLRRDPGRVYSGVYLPYDGGAVYRYNATTGSAYANRDFSAPSLNVKSNAVAAARAQRYLADMASQDERISTTVELPAAIASKIKSGMRVPFKATHLPGYGTAVWTRVLEAAPKAVAASTRYSIGLTLVPAYTVVTSTMIGFVALRGGTTSGWPPVGWNNSVTPNVRIAGTEWTYITGATAGTTGNYPMDMAWRKPVAGEPLNVYWPDPNLAPVGYNGSSRPHAIHAEFANTTGTPTGATVLSNQSTSSQTFTSPSLTVAGAGYIVAGFSYSAPGPSDGSSAAYTWSSSDGTIIEQSYAYGSFAPKSCLVYRYVSGAGSYTVSITRDVDPRNPTSPWACIAVYVPASASSLTQSAVGDAPGGSVTVTWGAAP